jgi:hypothetical protein
MVQRLACRLILDSLLVYSCISPRGGRDFSVDIKGIFGFKYRVSKAIKIYRADGNYPKFYRNFLIKSDNGRSSLRITNTFSLKVTFIVKG